MVSLNQLIRATHPSVPFLKKTDYKFASLTFKKSTGGAIDGYGNPTGSEVFPVEAHLYLTTSSEANLNVTQGQQSKIYRGHSINPRFLPDWVVTNTGGRMTLGDRSYDFILRSIDRTSMPAYSVNFGERLELEVFANTKSV
jgi:hypothetical protein